MEERDPEEAGGRCAEQLHYLGTCLSPHLDVDDKGVLRYDEIIDGCMTLGGNKLYTDVAIGKVQRQADTWCRQEVILTMHDDNTKPFNVPRWPECDILSWNNSRGRMANSGERCIYPGPERPHKRKDAL